MKRLHLSGEKSKNILTCIGVGLLAAVTITVFLTIALTSLIQKEKFDENGIFGVFFVRLIAILIGGLLGMGLSDNKILPVVSGISVGYLLVLLGVGVILFDGAISKLWLGVLSVVIGAAIALLVKLKSQTTRKKVMRYAK